MGIHSLLRLRHKSTEYLFCLGTNKRIDVFRVVVEDEENVGIGKGLFFYVKIILRNRTCEETQYKLLEGFYEMERKLSFFVSL